jgi:polar amino acid transport system substrate-binding protein
MLNRALRECIHCETRLKSLTSPADVSQPNGRRDTGKRLQSPSNILLLKVNLMPNPVAMELAPTGTLRAAINLANFLLVTGKKPNGEPDGVAPDLAAAIADDLGVDIKYVPFATPGELADAVSDGAWDIGLIGAEPARAEHIDFTAAYVEIEATYLVLENSPLKQLEDVDQPGMRIAVSARSAYDLYLTRHLKHAELVRAEGLDASYELFVLEGLDALAGLKPRLLFDVETLGQARILEGRFTAVQQAVGTPTDRKDSAAYLRSFIETAKTSGLVAQFISRHQVKGLSVAPVI